jgi:pyrroline-5-carboxylate reductase
MNDDLRIGFLGAGKMATALAQGWLNAGLARADCLSASDPLPEARAAFVRATGGRPLTCNRQVVAESDLTVLAVKPQQMAEVLGEIAPAVNPARPLLVSVAAGVGLQAIADRLGGAASRLVRVMPNTPCLVGASASAYAAGPGATAEDVRLVDRLFNAVGRAFPVPEHWLDAVTGLSGSGPAFVFVIIEALSDGGVRMGLPRDLATQLAAQTVLGSAKMLLETGLHPGVLKDAVASPGGTTIAGLHALERGGLRAALIDAVEAATRRSAELGAPGSGAASSKPPTPDPRPPAPA